MPRMQFSDIYTYVEDISNVKSKRALIKQAIQMGLDEITEKNMPYLMSEGVIELVAPYTTGTVTATQDSTTITGSGTTFTSAMVGRKIRVASDNTYYKIASFTNATSIAIETPFKEATTSGATFSIYKDEYRLNADVHTYKVLRHLSDRISVIDIDTNIFDILQPSPTSEGGPRFSLIAGSKLDTYTTGTLSGTISTSTLTGSGTSWDTVEGLSRGTRITIGTSNYTVKSVDSATQITIYEVLGSTISAGTSYVAHMDNLLLQLFNIPDSNEIIRYRYQRIVAPLINDEDIPDLPDNWQHVLVTAGLIWAWATKDKGQSNIQTQLFKEQRDRLWASLSNPSKSLKIPKVSMDDVGFPVKEPTYPSNIGQPSRIIR